ncbi:hypothetical protein LSTR_LSTR012638 [Laodelphax striatellus]|uniref:Uncharacterized protein n=1 Tax=Laodelphax striatellus TaxID=195883 RepID=A0A482XGR2_LAOST|nr:hypothetical protein LSTR_LSTR012638 [Laodelphax striatellus]
MEENGMLGVAEEQQLASFPNVADTAALDAGQITGLLNKENELAYNQNECLVTYITGNEFRVEGQDIMGADEDPNMIGINEGGNFGETAPQYTQVYLMNQGENLVEGSHGNNAVENSIPVMQDVVSTGSMDDNHIYVVASDGKSMYVDNQDVVFQIANDQVYQADSGRKNEIEVVYETPANMTDLGLVKEEVIDPSYDE